MLKINNVDTYYGHIHALKKNAVFMWIQESS